MYSSDKLKFLKWLYELFINPIAGSILFMFLFLLSSGLLHSNLIMGIIAVIGSLLGMLYCFYKGTEEIGESYF